MNRTTAWMIGFLLSGLALTGAAQTESPDHAHMDHSQMDHNQMHSAAADPGVAAGGHMDRHFENADEWAKEFDDPGRDQWQKPDQVIAALGLKRGQSVADLGAGTGYFTVRLAKSAAAPKVFAADIEPSMVDHLRRRAAGEGLKNVVAVQATAESANLPQPVDWILIVDTYHHIANRPAYFARLAASLKPNGRIAIIDWRHGGPMGPPEDFRFTPEQLDGEMKQAGFTAVARHDFLPNQMFLVYGR